MPPHRSPRVAALTDKSVQRAVRYLLQLAMEWESDRAAYEDGAAVLAHVSELLEAHRKRRAAMKTKALVAELVAGIMERFQLEDLGEVYRYETCRTVVKWLRRVGIERSEEEVKALLADPPVRRGARTRTRREHLLGKLAELVGASQSDFEKLVNVVERAKENPGRLGNPLLHERAATDSMAGQHEMLVFAMDTLGIDVPTGREIVRLLSLEQIHEDGAGRRHAATLLADGQRAKAARRGARSPVAEKKKQ